MISVGQVLSGVYPSFYCPSEIERDREAHARLKSRQRLMPWEHPPVKAVVEWIHPEKRFCVIRFEYGPGRCFRECRGLTRRKR